LRQQKVRLTEPTRSACTLGFATQNRYTVSMNYNEFLKRVSDSGRAKDLRQSSRVGQHLMNELNKVSPIAYSRIPSELDPFYNDFLLPDFLNYLKANWDGLTEPLHSPERK